MISGGPFLHLDPVRVAFCLDQGRPWLMKGAAAGNAESLAMIRAVVAMADSLEMITMAEGVETPEELQIACSLGAAVCRVWPMAAHGVDRPACSARAAPPAQEERAG
jgi:predicted signal transduction protein with EAL and GGDEF domain